MPKNSTKFPRRKCPDSDTLLLAAFFIFFVFSIARNSIADEIDRSSIFYVSPSRLAGLVEKAESGDGASATIVANYYMFVDRRERSKAERFLEIAANHSDVRAQHNLGVYLETSGDPQKMAKAIDWFAKAARGGDSVSARKLGRIYQEGSGVPQDLREAAKWYRLAVEAGDTTAMMALLDIVTNNSQEYLDNLEAYILARHLCVAYASDANRRSEYINQIARIKSKLSAEEIEHAGKNLPGPVSFGCE